MSLQKQRACRPTTPAARLTVQGPNYLRSCYTVIADDHGPRTVQKRTFPTKGAARKVSRRFPGQAPYRCGICGWWHNGHSSKPAS